MISFSQFNEAKTTKSHPWYVHSPSSFKTNSKMGRFESEEEAKAYVKRTQKHMPKNKLEIGKGKYPIVKEGFLDDVLKDFEPVSQAEIDRVLKKSDDTLAKYSISKTKSPYKKYSPRKYNGQKQEGFAEYIRSPAELKKACEGRVTLENIIKIFANGNLKISDSFQPMVEIKELWKIREYDRKMVDGYTGKNSESEMKKLKASIKKHGIKQYGHVSIDRRKNGDVEVLLGEGNHRLNIAKEVGIKEMPIMFSYGNL